MTILARSVSLCFAVAAFLLSALFVQGIAAQAASIEYTETPFNITSRTNATFNFNIVDGNGTNPCILQQKCSIICQLDQSPLQDCVNRRATFSNLGDGSHIFSVFVNISGGATLASEYHWTIDTVAPTAVVDGGQAFTNGQNVTVSITFSEKCVGFVCSNASYCDLLVYGSGAVIPFSLKEIQENRIYSLIVALSTDYPSGKINAVIAQNACADSAGNLLQRNNRSTSVIRFDRTVPSVNLWTAVPSSEVVIDNQPRTYEATNRASDLRVYLDFDSPVTSSAEDLLGLLSISRGVLTATARKSFGNRRFGFRLSNITNAVSEFTITLAANKVSNRYGTLVPGNSSITLLYDNERPQVHLITTSRAKTKDTRLFFVVQFTEPVFGFNSTRATILGGTLKRFKEIDKSTYTLEVKALDGKLVTVSVPENQSVDIAGNSNLASSSIQVRNYVTPWISVVLYFLIAVGLVSTALVSVALSISSATLVAAGAVPERKIGDPSRNLLGLACHLQVISLSGWLAVSLPVEYREVASGLRWLIPHVNTPWQDKAVIETYTSNFTNAPIMLQDVIKARRRILSVDNGLDALHHMQRGRKLGENATMHGSALGPGDYELYFLRNVSEQGESLKSLLNLNKNDGWQDFQRTMFWMGVMGGSLILLHIILVLLLQWRTTAPLRGALTIPRFELYFLNLAIPGLCQASAFIIRGGTPVGIIVGSLVLSVPVACFISLSIFLIYGVFLGALVQYKEFRYEVHRHGYLQPQKPQGLVNLIAGTGYPGKWVRNFRLASTFLPRYGFIFEDYKGPPTILVHKRVESLRDSFKRTGSKNETADADDESNDFVEVSGSHQILGGARAAYILVDLARRIALGVAFGLYPGSDRSWSQVGTVVGVSVVQFGYLVAVKPFRKRGVQVVETISLLCELGIFAAAMVLLMKGDPTGLDRGVGIFMLSLVGISFVFQLVNEWYALLERLMRLSTASEPTLKDGLRKFAGGLILPFTPRRTWAKFGDTREPESSVAISSSHSRSGGDSIEPVRSQGRPQQVHPFQEKAFALPRPISLPYADTMVTEPRRVNAGSIAQIMAIDVDSSSPTLTEEIQVEPSPRSARQLTRTQWGSCMSVGEGRRSKNEGTQELKMLRELAKASFSRYREDSDHVVEQRALELSADRVEGFGSMLQSNPSPTGSSLRVIGESRHVQRRRQLFGMPQRPRSDAESISEAASETDGGSVFLHEDLTSSSTEPEIGNLDCPPVVSPSNSDRSTIGKSPRGHVDSSHSVSLRDTSGAIRPLEDR